MTEKQKMLSQKLHLDSPELIKERKRAKDLCFRLNNTKPSQKKKIEKIAHKILGRAGSFLEIISPFWCDYGYNIEVGDHFFSNHDLVILDCAKVKIGNNVFFAPDCGIYTVGHPIDTERRNKGYEYAYPVTIGDNVWVCAGVTILPGVTIGSNVVIGAGSVVVKDIPDNGVALGNPCKVVRPITEKDREKIWDR